MVLCNCVLCLLGAFDLKNFGILVRSPTDLGDFGGSRFDLQITRNFPSQQKYWQKSWVLVERGDAFTWPQTSLTPYRAAQWSHSCGAGQTKRTRKLNPSVPMGRPGAARPWEALGFDAGEGA